MNATKIITMLVAGLVVSAGAGAVTAAQTDTDTDADAGTAATVDASYDNGTVTVSVTQNGSAVENVSVAADGEEVGTTDANGSLTFETNASEELELAFEGESVDLERTYAIEDGELVAEDEEDEEKGPDENASERAHSVFAVIQDWMSGDGDGNLGQMIQDAVDNGNDDAPGNSGDAPGNSNDSDAENESDAPGKSGEAPGNAPDSDDESADDETASDEDEADEADEEDEESDDEDDDENPGNGNGNGNGNN